MCYITDVVKNNHLNDNNFIFVILNWKRKLSGKLFILKYEIAWKIIIGSILFIYLVAYCMIKKLVIFTRIIYVLNKIIYNEWIQYKPSINTLYWMSIIK